MSNKLRDTMEVVASRVDELGKSKIVPLPPQPTPTTSQSRGQSKPRKKRGETAYAEWDTKQYKGTEEQRRKERENRRLIREKKQKEAEEELAREIKALQPLHDEEEAEEPPQPDLPVPPPVPAKPTKPVETTAARNRRYEMERRRTDKAQCEAEKAKATEQPDDPDPPKAKSPKAKPTTKPKGKSPGRTSTGAKKPKAKDTDKHGDDNATDRGVDQAAKKTTMENVGTDDAATSRAIGMRSTVQHVDDDNYELDVTTGKFIKKKKEKPVVRDDDDGDDDIEMEEIDDEDKDKDYDPDKDADQGDDDDEQAIEEGENDDEDEDFPIPPLRNKKPTAKSSDKSSKKRKPEKQVKQKPSEDEGDLADFVEATFKKPVRQGTRKGRKDKKEDACINPIEAARFRNAMRKEALELEKAVKKGTNVPEAYETLITHVIEACKEMKYEIPVEIEASDILPTIEDLTCKAWQLKLQGVQTAGEGELNVSKADNSGVCVAKRRYEIKDIAAYMEEITADWSDLKRKDFKLTMKRVMGNMSAAHRMVAEASQEMITLLDEVELPVWMKLVDMTMRPLVLMEVPEVAVMCEEARQLSRENQQHWNQSTKITTIMEAKNLPFLPTTWGYKVEGRAKKVIAGIIYKYVKDQMYAGELETPATEVSSKYALNATTMNRHILGKKYEGGKASGSGTRRPAAVKVSATERLVDKSKQKAPTQEDEGEQSAGKSKGKGKSSGVTRSAQEIRDESTSDQQKQKARKRKADEAQLEEEDEDRPTEAEIKRSGPPKKHITIR